MGRRQKDRKEHRDFRCDILASALKNLPSTIFVNEAAGVYHIRDNTLMIAWADDLPQGGGNALLKDLSSFIAAKDRDAFLQSCLRSDEDREREAGRSCPHVFLLKARGNEAEQRASFIVTVGQNSKGRIFEIRIDQ